MATILTVFFGFLLVIVISALCAFPSAGILYLVYKYVLLALIPALPVITFWQMYLIFWALATIGGCFRSSTTVRKD